ncbi:hypothetical protein [Mesorhizobium sp. M8A.F.Ca.ET.021.01.1.1]|uniref:hypothetical protein n=1 Tax=Mesorhizobium sp. M8A.F.Ca.ET.021.01.1.1 TaxID=2496757 RepID=UPI000FD1B827|nr:hypothetical protein [Mesorhizobium sp. M8A.F.Ca.ET.021.01.1.1]RUW56849.1 hypothetical protein EOA36_02300 [Mesorhizobium sp. M8A.F.Ca.ET.021.01.1.1]
MEPRDMWFRAVCDMYEELPVFPALTRRELHGNSAQGIEAFKQPRLVDGKPIEIGGETYEHSIHGTMARPGAVWMTRRMFLECWSEFFGIERDTVLYDDMKSIANNLRESLGGRPSKSLKGRAYHPAQFAFQRQTQPTARERLLPKAFHKREGRVFSPHDIEHMKDELEIEPILAEQYAYHRRRTGGEAPKTTGQFMIHPDHLDRIGKSHIWDLFLERRAAFDIENMASKPNLRMYDWRELRDLTNTLPVFDRETLMRITADPNMWGKDAATARTVDKHLTKWFAAEHVRRVRYGLYAPARPMRHDFTKYEPFGSHYLSDWFFEFLRRQAARQRMLPSQTFTFETMRDDIGRFHADWQKFHRTNPSDLTMRERLNNETISMGKTDGDFVERANAKERRLSPAALDLFAPADATFFKRNGPRK